MAKQTKAAAQKNAVLQLLVPLLALFLLIVFNLIRDPGFFAIEVRTNNLGNMVLFGNVVSILNEASELAILAMGLTLVTAASKGQDISVGAIAAIAGSVFVRVLLSNQVTLGFIFLGFLAACAVAMIFGAFNGTLVAVFKIQPMIATLIMFTTGRSIAYWINGGASPTVPGQLLGYFGGFIPGIPIPTPIFWVVICAIIFALVLKYTNLGLYAQSVGINEQGARLNGINAVWIKLLTFMIFGVCAAVAGTISVARQSLINHEKILLGIEMDAILAVAIGGNALSGGKFKMVGSVIGAYVIEGLTVTLYAMQVSSTAVSAYKAVVIIALVIIGSPVVKRAAGRLWGGSGGGLFRKKEAIASTEGS